MGSARADAPRRRELGYAAAARAVALALQLALVGACESEGTAPRDGDPSSPSGQLTVSGSSTVAPLVGEMAHRFEQHYPQTRVDVQAGGSSRGIADVRAGTTDLGMVSRALAPDESELHVWPIARDGVGLIVHRDNPVASLRHQQVIAIYRGATRNWRHLGGSDAPIVVLNKAEGHATLEVFRSHFDLASSEIRADVVIGHNQQGIKTVAANRHAIGYVSIGAAAQEMARGVPIRLLQLDGIAATAEHVANGSFPIARPLHLISRGVPGGLAQAFVEYCQSEIVYDLIESQHLVPYAD